MMDRRSFLTGLSTLIAAPSLVRASSLMPVRGIIVPVFDTAFQVQYRMQALADYSEENAYSWARTTGYARVKGRDLALVTRADGTTLIADITGGILSQEGRDA